MLFQLLSQVSDPFFFLKKNSYFLSHLKEFSYNDCSNSSTPPMLGKYVLFGQFISQMFVLKGIFLASRNASGGTGQCGNSHESALLSCDMWHRLFTYCSQWHRLI